MLERLALSLSLSGSGGKQCGCKAAGDTDVAGRRGVVLPTGGQAALEEGQLKPENLSM